MTKYFILILNTLSKLPIGGTFFKTFLAAAAVGSGSTAIKNKNYKYAFHILKRFEHDEIDDVWVASCQYMLGNLYLNGLGTTKNEKKAITIFQASASAGNRDAITYMRRWNAKQRAKNSNK